MKIETGNKENDIFSGTKTKQILEIEPKH